jgi:hypothetical protein
MDGKFFVLSSNCNKDLYGEINTASHFFVDLAEPLVFPEESRWGLGLRELSYSSTIPTLTNESILISYPMDHPTEEFKYTGQAVQDHPRIGGYINPAELFYKTTYSPEIPSGANVIVKIHELWAYPITGYTYTVMIGKLEKFVRVTSHEIKNFVFKRVQIDIGLLWVLKVEYDVTVHREIKLEQSYFETGSSLIKAFNKKTLPLGVKFTINKLRVKLSKLPKGVTIKLQNNMEFVLGFKNKILDTVGVIGAYNIRLQRGILSLYIYMSILENNLVGDVYVPLLRNVAIVKHAYGNMIHRIIENPIYVPINRKIVRSIEVQISDDSGENITFQDGKTTMLLEIKRI